jgi:hypothetical protein
MDVDVGRELAVLLAELAPLDDDAPAVAMVARLASIAQELAASAVIDAATLPARDDRLLIEGLCAFAARVRAADPACVDPAASPAAVADAPRCWSGVSGEDGLPWMYCATARVARAAIAVIAPLRAAAGRGDRRPGSDRSCGRAPSPAPRFGRTLTARRRSRPSCRRRSGRCSSSPSRRRC